MIFCWEVMREFADCFIKLSSYWVHWVKLCSPTSITTHLQCHLEYTLQFTAGCLTLGLLFWCWEVGKGMLWPESL